MPVHRRHLDGIAQAQVVKFIKFSRRLPQCIAFVDAQDDRLAALFEHGRHFLIGGYHPRGEVGDHDNDVGQLNGKLGLPAHLGKNDVIRRGLNTAGVHQADHTAAPFGIGINAVSGDPGRVVYNGQAAPDYFIEQGGFAHVRASNHSYQRFVHCLLPSGGTAPRWRRARAKPQSLPFQSTRFEPNLCGLILRPPGRNVISSLSDAVWNGRLCRPPRPPAVPLHNQPAGKPHIPCRGMPHPAPGTCGLSGPSPAFDSASISVCRHPRSPVRARSRLSASPPTGVTFTPRASSTSCSEQSSKKRSPSRRSMLEGISSSS